MMMLMMGWMKKKKESRKSFSSRLIYMPLVCVKRRKITYTLYIYEEESRERKIREKRNISVRVP
jgi:hypothetical protein